MAIATVLQYSMWKKSPFGFGVRGVLLALGLLTPTFARIDAEPTLPYGLFGDRYVDIYRVGSVDSAVANSNPFLTAAHSTGQATVGSNSNIILHTDSCVDGSIYLGAQTDGVPAVITYYGSNQVTTGIAGSYVGRIDPDPLGIASGALATLFTEVSTNNDNSAAIPPIPGSLRIDLGHGNAMTLYPGRYRVSSVELDNTAELNLQVSNGTVNLFVSSAVELRAGSSVNVFGPATNFCIYVQSNSMVNCYTIGGFEGLIYAPYASVKMSPAGPFHGAIWAAQVQVLSSAETYLVNEFVDWNRPETRDVDGDELLDGWERRFVGSITGLSASVDSDVDGFPNVMECGWDSDPFSATSTPPRLLWSDGGFLEIPWASTGRVYGVDVSINLEAWSGWTNGIPGTGAPLLLTIPDMVDRGMLRATTIVP